jgi:hypothetical protein
MPGQCEESLSVNPHFRDILSALSVEGAEFLVVGAYALAGHGLPRATGDLDIWVRPTSENAQRVWRALLRFGAPLTSSSVKDFETLDNVFRMGLPPNQIDILTSISGLEFDQAWPNRVKYMIEGNQVFLISPADQVRNKRATDRPKDKIDADWLERNKNDPNA